jgi:CBS domain-containing protein
MSIGEYCNREMVVVAKTESVSDAIHLMRSQHVGDVVVIDRQGDLAIPIGILTDRDIVLEVLAEGVDLEAIVMGDVMSDELVTVNQTTSLMATIKLMQEKAVRRLPVVDERGGVVGIITVDDLLELIAEQLQGIVSLVAKQQQRERARRK